MKLPHTTEEVLWGGDLVFKIGGKMYAVTALEPGAVWLSFKCTPENFGELTEREGIVPAPYLARHHWAALESGDALPAAEPNRLIGESYGLVLGKLPKRAQERLQGGVHRGDAEPQRKRTKKNTGRARRGQR